MINFLETIIEILYKDILEVNRFSDKLLRLGRASGEELVRSFYPPICRSIRH